MYQEQTLYRYLYEILIRKIKSGEFLQLRSLPSQKQLCQQYNVGITTVRKVIKMLHEEGYIHASSGQSPVVIYNASVNDYISELVKRKEEVDDAFGGLGLLLPHLYKEAVGYICESDITIMQRAIDNIHEDMDMHSLYRQPNLFFTTLVKVFDNPLIIDLELDAENFLHIPFLPFHDQTDPFYRTPSHMRNWLNSMYGYIRNHQEDLLYEKIASTYQNSRRRVKSYLQVLEEQTCILPFASDKSICWFHIKDRSELYTHLAMTILRRIRKGEFSDQKYIPSIPRIMKEYGVMKETASRSIALLNSLGITQTINKKGTVILSETRSMQYVEHDLNDPIIKQRLLYCLDALQLIALSINSGIPFDISGSNSLAENFQNDVMGISREKKYALIIQFSMDFIIQSVQSHSLKNIYQQLNDLLVWGYYLETVDQALYADSKKTEIAIHDFLSVLKEKDNEAFPCALQHVFLQVYRDLYHVILKLPYDFGVLPKLI